MRVLLAGCGWLGTALGEALAARGHAAIGVRRDPRALEALAAAGIVPLRADLNEPAVEQRLPRDLDAILACASADGPSAADYRRAYLDALDPLLGHARTCGAQLVFVSSTRVFGQGDGGWVDERTPVAPADEQGAALVEAELRVLAQGGIVLRLSGLYGPGRYGVIERVRRGELALGAGDDAWTNWCHRDDAVRALEALLEHERSGVFHASDAEPLRRRDVVAWIAGRLGIEPPAAVIHEPQGPLSRGANRRVLATTTREELGLALAFPSLRDGLCDRLPDAGGSASRARL